MAIIANITAAGNSAAITVTTPGWFNITVEGTFGGQTGTLKQKTSGSSTFQTCLDSSAAAITFTAAGKMVCGRFAAGDQVCISLGSTGATVTFFMNPSEGANSNCTA